VSGAGLELARVDAYERLASLHHITFVHEHLGDSSHQLRTERRLTQRLRDAGGLEGGRYGGVAQSVDRTCDASGRDFPRGLMRFTAAGAEQHGRRGNRQRGEPQAA
jgi:hypothetical protein